MLKNAFWLKKNILNKPNIKSKQKKIKKYKSFFSFIPVIIF